MSAPSRSVFRSLNYFNYRLWFIGGLISNIGTWMQRLAQYWLVLTQLTHHNAAAVGYVTALQFGPQVLLLPFTGSATDRYNRRRIVIVTQIAMAMLALALGALVVFDLAHLWHVYLLALAQGVFIAFDAPARQTFVADMVGEDDLANAIALNSASNNVSRMIGPAIAGALIATIGTGWVFLANAASFAAALVALAAMRPGDLLQVPAEGKVGGLREAVAYIWTRAELRAAFVIIFLIGTFAMNFPIFVSTMAVGAFRVGASDFGMLTSVMAIGSIVGAVIAARLDRPRFGLFAVCSTMLGFGLLIAAVMPTLQTFGVCLVFLGVTSQIFLTGGNSFVQIATRPDVRGRVVALLLVAAQGGTPIGAPLVGWVANLAGPRWGMGIGALAGLVAAFVAALHLLRLHRPSHGPKRDAAALEGSADSGSDTKMVS